MEIDWAEKYRPKKLNEVLGNDSAIDKLRDWAEKWSISLKKCAILIGPPGVGKTTSALALANELGWEKVELNASDVRNYERLKKLTPAVSSQTFDEKGNFLSTKKMKMKLLVLDEVDSLYEATEPQEMGDRGGKRAIRELIETSSQPIVLIVNDLYELIRGYESFFRENCEFITFEGVEKSAIISKLREICKAENIEVSYEVLDYISSRAGGDVRSAINDLQSLAMGRKKIGLDSLGSVGYRDPRATIFEAIREIFKSTSIKDAMNAIEKLDEEPGHILLWIDENMPLEYRSVPDLVEGYDALARADLFLSRARRRQNYRYWVYANFFMSGGVAMGKRKKYTAFVRYGFPSWLSKMAKSKTSRQTRDAVIGKLGTYCHTVDWVVTDSILPLFKFLFKKDARFAAEMISKLELDVNETEFIVGDREEAEKLVKDSEKLRKEWLSLYSFKTVKEKKKEKQRSLGDF
ncbi:MAG: replication factor C large subunit [Candidatus Thermoplasmatota archaeon]